MNEKYFSYWFLLFVKHLIFIIGVYYCAGMGGDFLPIFGYLHNNSVPYALSLHIGRLCLGCPSCRDEWDFIFNLSICHSPCFRHLSFSSSQTARHYYRGGTLSDFAPHGFCRWASFGFVTFSGRRKPSSPAIQGDCLRGFPGAKIHLFLNPAK